MLCKEKGGESLPHED
ncbi:unnamed protein product [Spirodela intermedia]|uniref:Uncharacterized protein n=1 Tax=Spirodela intermedia TaxID=51605 RepID=A0A7I8LGC0_SPIIN|nr:unnamed protein product [Spirodela intermedia]